MNVLDLNVLDLVVFLNMLDLIVLIFVIIFGFRVVNSIFDLVSVGFHCLILKIFYTIKSRRRK